MSNYNQIGRTSTTVANDDNGNTALTYHQTKVVVWNAEQITLNSGGYRTATTKHRMMEASTVFNLGFFVWQVKGEWIVKFGDKEFPFNDGMILDRVTGEVRTV